MDTAAYDRDCDHLKLLTIFHYIVGGLTIAMASFFIIHFAMALMMYANPDMLPKQPQGPQPPQALWLVFACFAGGMILLGWTFGILTIVSGRMMAKRRARTFSFIIAGLNCFCFPYGTALGVCTILVLSRDSVRQLYDHSRQVEERRQEY
jgi:hypothetical protein